MMPAAGHEQAALRRRVEWLREQGSNLQPSGYEGLNISAELGLSHHPPRQDRAWGVGRL